MESKIPVLAIVGPTASGKTGLAVAMAKQFNAEVLSFDSMQLYKGMDVATAKPTPEEMENIPHHMIDVIDPEDAYSVVRYQEDARRIIEDIRSRGKNVIMVGGTGLYLDAFLQNLSFLDGGDNGETRARLQQELEELGPDIMYDRLKAIDPEAAAKLEKNNTGRVLRALEVYETTGHTITYQVEQSHNNPSPYEAFYVGLTAENRDYLYDRINLRVDFMLQTGLLEETETFLKEGAGCTASQAIGVKEMVPYFKGEATLEECTENLKKVTRHYAKRQLTWFRKNQAVHWFYIDNYDTKEALYEAVADCIAQSKILEEKGDCS